MAAGGGQAEPDRLDPAKLTAYPKILDIDNDILVPQFIDRWMGELKVALSSRYLMEVLDEPEPTLRETAGAALANDLPRSGSGRRQDRRPA